MSSWFHQPGLVQRTTFHSTPAYLSALLFFLPFLLQYFLCFGGGKVNREVGPLRMNPPVSYPWPLTSSSGEFYKKWLLTHKLGWSGKKQRSVENRGGLEWMCAAWQGWSCVKDPNASDPCPGWESHQWNWQSLPLVWVWMLRVCANYRQLQLPPSSWLQPEAPPLWQRSSTFLVSRLFNTVLHLVTTPHYLVTTSLL